MAVWLINTVQQLTRPCTCSQCTTDFQICFQLFNSSWIDAQKKNSTLSGWHSLNHIQVNKLSDTNQDSPSFQIPLFLGWSPSMIPHKAPYLIFFSKSSSGCTKMQSRSASVKSGNALLFSPEGRCVYTPMYMHTHMWVHNLKWSLMRFLHKHS